MYTYPPKTLDKKLCFAIYCHHLNPPQADFKNPDFSLNTMKSLIAEINSSIAEMKKVTWPTKNQVINYSVVVVALSVGLALFFGFLDYLLSTGLQLIIS